MGELVLVERRDDGVAVITLNNPKVNALSQALLAELRAAAEEMIADPAGAVVITGGERIFAAGADISEFGSADQARAITGGRSRGVEHGCRHPEVCRSPPSAGMPARWRVRARAGVRLSHRRRTGSVRAT